jgi:hypothetical protein
LLLKNSRNWLCGRLGWFSRLFLRNQIFVRTLGAIDASVQGNGMAGEPKQNGNSKA